MGAGYAASLALTQGAVTGARRRAGLGGTCFDLSRLAISLLPGAARLWGAIGIAGQGKACLRGLHTPLQGDEAGDVLRTGSMLHMAHSMPFRAKRMRDQVVAAANGARRTTMRVEAR